MALTLPYPSMSFVPLDVLTAEEMNHIVSNYTYIANQFPIATDNIANGAITPEKASFTEYSTTETVVGTWYNGKPIYRRVFTGTAPLTVNTTSDMTLIGSGVDDIISAKGRWKYYTAAAYYVAIGDAINEGAVYSSVVQPAPGKIVLRLRTSYTLNSDYVVAAEYTKTTD
jgi:hypothetical protein